MSGVQEDYIKKSKDIFKYLNEFRKNPKTMAKHLENLKKHLDKKSNVLSEPGKIQVQMVEGEVVFNEAIEYLNSLPSLKPFEWDENLAMSAMEHVLDIGPKGLLSYQSSDGTEPEDRITKYGNFIDSLGENIDFGPNDAMGVLISLTLDDGEPDRPHRENLFKTDYLKLGIACGPHKTEYQMCVMDFAFDFVGLGEEQNDEVVNMSNLLNQTKNNGTTNKSNNNELFNGTKNQINQSNININNKFTPDHQVDSRKDKYNDNLVDPKNTSFNKITTGKPTSTYYDNTFGAKNDNLDKFTNNNSNINSKNQSPLVRLSLDKDEYKNFKESELGNQIRNSNTNEDEILAAQVRNINSEKKVICKLIEVTTRIVYTFEDGSTKEVIDKQNHTFDLNHNN